MPTFHGPDWFSHHRDNWRRWLGHFQDRPNTRAIEIGTYEGRAACWLLENILTGPDSQLVCIDPHSYQHSDAVAGERFSSLKPEKVFAAWQANLAEYVAAGRCRLIPDASIRALLQLICSQQPQWDLVYIDGSHLARCCLEDSVLAWQLLRPGGIVIWDDYIWRPPAGRVSPTCKVAIDAFLQCYAGCYEELERGRQVKVRKVR
jgi:predicted O-methyltransferase YrrM